MCRTAPPTAGQFFSCSSQTRFGGCVVIATQPHASHESSGKDQLGDLDRVQRSAFDEVVAGEEQDEPVALGAP
jgi:hypothetical protein